MADASKEHIYALIICGGAGTRLWPRSRKITPKQFLSNFYGKDTLFQQTVARALLLTESNKIFVITLSEYKEEILRECPHLMKENIISEPFGKNTAMAIGVGTAYIRNVDPEAVIVNLWSDAVIKENDIFIEKLMLAVQAANKGSYLVVVGLKPKFPHTGLGYIEGGDKFSEITEEVYKVKSFKEKPDLKTAEGFLSSGNYYWNTGILVWSAKAIFEAFAKHSPAIYDLLEKVGNAIGSDNEKEVFAQAYEEVENQPIDTAVSEKAENMLLVPADFTWSDIGGWQVYYDLKDKDSSGNVIEVFGNNGQHQGIDTSGCLISMQNRLVATIGVSDLVIVETDEAILICQKEKTQDVKKIVTMLKEQGEDKYL